MIEQTNLSRAKFFKTAVNRGTTGKKEGGVTFVFSKNGKRIEFSEKILEMLGQPTHINFKYDEHYIYLINDNEGNILKNMGKRKVVYNSALIGELLEVFSLKIEGVCKTFSDIEQIEGEKAVAIKVKEVIANEES